MEQEELIENLRILRRMGSEVSKEAARAQNRILAEFGRMHDEIKDWKDCGEAAEHPAPDEKHCTCVPLLLHTIRTLRTRLARLEAEKLGT
jgi:hypothetical protein